MQPPALLPPYLPVSVKDHSRGEQGLSPNRKYRKEPLPGQCPPPESAQPCLHPLHRYSFLKGGQSQPIRFSSKLQPIMNFKDKGIVNTGDELSSQLNDRTCSTQTPVEGDKRVPRDLQEVTSSRSSPDHALLPEGDFSPHIPMKPNSVWGPPAHMPASWAADT